MAGLTKAAGVNWEIPRELVEAYDRGEISVQQIANKIQQFASSVKKKLEARNQPPKKSKPPYSKPPKPTKQPKTYHRKPESEAKHRRRVRNEAICLEYRNGATIQRLMDSYHLTEATIRTILYHRSLEDSTFIILPEDRKHKKRGRKPEPPKPKPNKVLRRKITEMKEWYEATVMDLSHLVGAVERVEAHLQYLDQKAGIHLNGPAPGEQDGSGI